MKTLRHLLWTATLSCGILGSGAAGAAQYYVQHSGGDDANPGDQWGGGHALATIQRALDLAAATTGGDTIHVAAGTYAEHLTVGSNNIVLLGGYPANGGTQRNRKTNPTVISGTSNGIPVSISSVAHITVDGFIIRNGVNQAAGNGIGGGISLLWSNDVTINGNTIESNVAADWGGGIGILGSTDVSVSNNALRNNRGQAGGAISLYGQSEAAVSDNTLSGNTAHDDGGGIVANASSLRVSRNTISGNRAHNGGGMAVSECSVFEMLDNSLSQNQAESDGGGLLHYQCDGSIRNNRIQNNLAGNWGGGICIRTAAHPKNLTNNLITSNRAHANGGGISLFDRSTANIVNNTIANNRADTDGSGVYVDAGTTATVRNSILWGNTGPSLGQISNNGTVTVAYSNIAGGWSGAGNIDSNPLWVLKNDYHLTETSPCRDQASATGAPAKDLDGTPRPYGAGFDMGAYEWTPGPDLVGSWKTLTTSSGGKAITVYFILRNRITDQNAGPFATAFYLSPDGKSIAGKPFKTVNSPAGLAGGAQQTVKFQYTFPASMVGQYIVSKVDVNRTVREVNERNNRRSIVIPAP